MADETIGIGELLPRPDPTRLTTDQLRRELASLREILTARLDGMDRATKLLDETVNRTPTEIQKQITHLKELLETRLGTVESISLTRLGAIEQKFEETDRRYEQQFMESDRRYEQRFAERDIRFREEFNGVDQQFAERDIRASQATEAAKQALGAALQAQKELVSQQNESNVAAAAKAEASFTKQIDQIGTIIQTLEKSLTDRITELKERIDRGEGTTSGAAGRRTESRLDIGLLINFLMIAIIAAGTIFAIIHG